MKWIVSLAVLAAVGWGTHITLETADDAGVRLAFQTADEIAAVGDDAGALLAYGTLVEKYPYLPASFAARSALADVPGFLDGDRRDEEGALRDPLWLDGNPHVGPAGLLALALVLLLGQVFGPRSRVRVPALLLLLAAGGLGAVGQGLVPLPTPAEEDWTVVAVGQVERLAYAGFPWLAAGTLGLTALLGLAPRKHQR